MPSISERSLTLAQFGLRVVLAGDDALRVTPVDRITPAARDYIQTHKAALRNRLQGERSFQAVGDITAGIVTALAIRQPTPAPALPADLMERVSLICQLERWPEIDKTEWLGILWCQIDRDGIPVAELVTGLDAHLARWHHTGEAIAERTAIMAHEGGLSRQQAQTLAAAVNDCLSCRYWQGVQTYPDPRYKALASAGFNSKPKTLLMGACAKHQQPWRVSNIPGDVDYNRWHLVGQCGWVQAEGGSRITEAGQIVR